VIHGLSHAIHGMLKACQAQTSSEVMLTLAKNTDQ
jgi:hypothetical protein